MDQSLWPEVAGANREVGKISVRCLRRRPRRIVAAEERRKEDSFNLQSGHGSEDEITLIQDELLIEPDTDTAVFLARLVQIDLLLEQMPFARLIPPLPSPQGGAVFDAAGQI